jgi:hypothetical protein
VHRHSLPLAPDWRAELERGPRRAAPSPRGADFECAVPAEPWRRTRGDGAGWRIPCILVMEICSIGASTRPIAAGVACHVQRRRQGSSRRPTDCHWPPRPTPDARYLTSIGRSYGSICQGSRGLASHLRRCTAAIVLTAAPLCWNQESVARPVSDVLRHAASHHCTLQNAPSDARGARNNLETWRCLCCRRRWGVRAREQRRTLSRCSACVGGGASTHAMVRVCHLHRATRVCFRDPRFPVRALHHRDISHAIPMSATTTLAISDPTMRLGRRLRRQVVSPCTTFHREGRGKSRRGRPGAAASRADGQRARRRAGGSPTLRRLVSDVLPRRDPPRDPPVTPDVRRISWRHPPPLTCNPLDAVCRCPDEQTLGAWQRRVPADRWHRGYCIIGASQRHSHAWHVDGTRRHRVSPCPCGAVRENPRSLQI